MNFEVYHMSAGQNRLRFNRRLHLRLDLHFGCNASQQAGKIKKQKKKKKKAKPTVAFFSCSENFRAIYFIDKDAV